MNSFNVSNYESLVYNGLGREFLLMNNKLNKKQEASTPTRNVISQLYIAKREKKRIIIQVFYTIRWRVQILYNRKAKENKTKRNNNKKKKQQQRINNIRIDADVFRIAREKEKLFYCLNSTCDSC